MSKNFKKRRAFSLVELSIVLVVIGIIIAGVIQSNNLYQKAQLSVAQSLTRSSPVSGIKDLMLWYETSLESSFPSGQSTDQASISSWYNNNPQAVFKNNASQSTSTQQPLFAENAFSSSIPSVRFDGSNDNLIVDDISSLVGASYYTIFLIEQKRQAFTAQTYILNFGTSGAGCCILFGYQGSTDYSFGLAYWSGGSSYSNSSALAYTEPKARMHTAIKNGSSTQYWYNGGTTAENSTSHNYTVAGNTNKYIGRFQSTYYKGDLGELIIYNRALTTEERQAVESYLGKKFKIVIS